MKRRVTRIAKLLFNGRTFAVVFLQAILIVCSVACAWLLRLDFSWGDRSILISAIPALLLIRLSTMWFFGLHHGWWRYAGVNDALDILKAVSLGSAVFFLSLRYGLHIIAFPKSIYVLEALLTASLLMGVRIVSRALAESVRQDWDSSKRVLIIGAGFAAQMLLREIRRPGSGYVPVGCLDDDLSKRGMKILGAPVLGSAELIPQLVKQFEVSEVLIAIPSANSHQMRRFVKICENSQVKFRTVPALRDFLLDQATLSQVREVNLEDLLGREPVRIDLDSVIAQLHNRVVMVTGAAGSIGSEICRQILRYHPSKLICLDQNETGLFYLEVELSKFYAAEQLVMSVADLQDISSVQEILNYHNVEVIFHAAAYKHVPLMESNVQEAVKNNVFAFTKLLDAGVQSGCDAFILISSDKAVNPTSVMGATKRICELIIASNPSERMRCVSVRFGNVLGSNGSLVPVLQEQLRRGLPLTITDPEIKRFFMTTQEAVSLVLQAFAIGSHRDILVLDMGKSLRILDLAKTLIKLHGKSEDDVRIVFTGLRKGEKFFEELFYETEHVLPTSFDKIKRTEGRILDWEQLGECLEGLRDAVANESIESIRDCIKKIVPEYVYTPNIHISDAPAVDAKVGVGF